MIDFSKMTNEELVAIYQDDSEKASTRDFAINQLVKQNEPMIHRIINTKYTRNSRIKTDDLVQAGRVGIFIAAQEFDFSYGRKFSTYAHYHIQCQLSEWVNKEIGKNDKPYYSALAAMVKNALVHFQEFENNSHPSAQEICDYINNTKKSNKKISVSSVYHALNAINASESISYENAVADNMIQEASKDSVEDYAINMDLRSDIINAINRLPAEEKYVFQMKTGYPFGKECSNDTVAKQMNKIPAFNSTKYSAFIVNKIYQKALRDLSHDPMLNQYNENTDYFDDVVDSGGISVISTQDVINETNKMFEMINTEDIPDYFEAIL
jgi:RNA polymerase primary sigma factor